MPEKKDRTEEESREEATAWMKKGSFMREQDVVEFVKKVDFEELLLFRMLLKRDCYPLYGAYTTSADGGFSVRFLGLVPKSGILDYTRKDSVTTMRTIRSVDVKETRVEKIGDKHYRLTLDVGDSGDDCVFEMPEQIQPLLIQYAIGTLGF